MRTLHLGNNIDILKTLPDNSVDSIVTDPPYGLGKEPDAIEVLTAWLTTGHHDVKGKGFMGKEWDAFVPQPAFWSEAIRVLKPGGHVLSFFGTRTYDWGVMAMRLAGFEVRDKIAWVFGSGFPKSLNIGKAVDKLQGNEREYVETKKKFHISTSNTNEGWKRPSHYNDDGTHKTEMIVTIGTSEWEGWGTALKPALEPIVLARKPIEKGLSIAENVLKWGTGGINIDACRVGIEERYNAPARNKAGGNSLNMSLNGMPQHAKGTAATGRFPANLIHDGSDEVLSVFPVTKCGVQMPHHKDNFEGNDKNCYGVYQKRMSGGFGDSGSAARYFYCAKASKEERNAGCENLEGYLRFASQNESGKMMPTKLNEPLKAIGNYHPTVKPLALMRYLCKLITPPGGIILDPFMGSGSTGCAAVLEGFNFVGCELDQEYLAIANARINYWANKIERQTKLF